MEKNININVTANTAGVKSLKQELRETVQALQQIPQGTAEFDAMANKAANIKDRMAEVNEQVNALASGSKFEKVSNSLGEMGAGLRDMDFDRVRTVDLFAKSAKAITFKDAIGSIKAMGSSLMTVGKAILTNPLFLIAGVVTLIVVGIVKLMDKLGLLKKVFEFVGGVIDAVVQSIKDFLDWIGLTSFAAEDAAQRQADAAEKTAKAYADKQAKIVDAYDQEIKLAGIAGENTAEIEKEKQRAIIETERAQYQALQTQMYALKAAGTLTKEKGEELKKSMLDLKKTINDARQEIEAIDAQTEADSKKKKNETTAAADAAAAKDRAAKAKQYAADRLAAQRSIQDAQLDLMEEGIQKELKANEIKYQRLIEDTKKNEKLLSSEKKTITAQLQEQEFEATKAIQQKYTDETNAQIEATNKAREEKAKADLIKREEAVLAAAETMAVKNKELLEKQLQDQKDFQDAKFFLANSFIGAMQGLEKLLNEAGVKTAGLQKTIALVQIATDTAKAISAVIAGATAAAAATGPAAPFVLAGYIATGIGTVLSAVGSAYAVLKKAPAMGGAVSGGAPTNVSTGAAPQVQQPNTSLFGQSNNANNLGANGSNEPMIVKAYVSETEITATQNKVAGIRNMATL